MDKYTMGKLCFHLTFPKDIINQDVHFNTANVRLSTLETNMYLENGATDFFNAICLATFTHIISKLENVL